MMQFSKPHYHSNFNILHFLVQEQLTCCIPCWHCIETNLIYRGNFVSSGTLSI